MNLGSEKFFKKSGEISDWSLSCESELSKKVFLRRLMENGEIEMLEGMKEAEENLWGILRKCGNQGF